MALGPDYAGMWFSDDGLKQGLLDAAQHHGELFWPMPLAPEYREQINSKIADLANLGAPGGGGSITAALFLKVRVRVRVNPNPNPNPNPSPNPDQVHAAAATANAHAFVSGFPEQVRVRLG